MIRSQPQHVQRINGQPHGFDADHFSELRAPVLYPYVAPKAPHNRGQFEMKVPGVMDAPRRGYDFVAEVCPRPEESSKYADVLPTDELAERLRTQVARRS